MSPFPLFPSCREMNIQEINLLFDEQGTPTFREDRKGDSFLGIGLAYEARREQEIFDSCAEVAGLKNKQPRKNWKITSSRVVKIAEVFSDLEVQVVVVSLDLSNGELENVITEYEELGNVIRRDFREVRERPVAQILHSHILDRCLFESITAFVDRFRDRQFRFNPMIDNWSISPVDASILLRDRSDSLTQQIGSRYQRPERSATVEVSPIRLLAEDSSRKRLVDVLASTVSRAFLKEGSDRYSREPVDIIAKGLGNRFKLIDRTKDEIDSVRELLKFHRAKLLRES